MKSHIIIDSKLKQRIAKLGDLTQNYEQVMEKIVEHVETCDHFWSKKE